jgi:arylsulfatase
VSHSGKVQGLRRPSQRSDVLTCRLPSPNADAPSTRKTQYFEIFGNRAIYHDGWMANTVPAVTPWEGVKGRPRVDVMNGYKWELYNLAEGPTQTNDLAAKEPERLRMMQELWIMEATRHAFV